ncbi:MAG: ABC transporter permease [Planctomyces sp.]|nr:ABC transporter permease [Planctomyces sp.]
MSDSAPSSERPSAPPRSWLSRLMKSGALIDLAGLAIVLLAIVAVFSWLSPRFFSQATLATIMNQIPALTILATGMTIVLISGGIDLSVGSLVAFSSAALGIVMAKYNQPLWLAIPAAIAAGSLFGLINGSVTVFGRIPSFIVTLGTLQIARGCAYLATSKSTIYLNRSVQVLTDRIAGIGLSPAAVSAMLIVVLGQLLLTRTVFGRYCVAIGTNESAVRMSGVDTRWTRIFVFVLCGALAGMAGVIESSRLSAVDPNGAAGRELQAIAAAVIGGTSLMGGRGSVIATLFGVLIMAVLESGLGQVGAQEEIKNLVTGSAIVVAVLFDSWRHRGTRRTS